MIIILGMVSCESKSGQLAKEDPIKVIVLDNDSSSEPVYYRGKQQITYKISVPNKGVVAYSQSFNKYEKGDTILVKPSLIRY